MKSANLYKEIEFLKDYFKAIKKEDGYIYIEVIFDEKWQIFDYDYDGIKIMAIKNVNNPKHIFFYSEDENNLSYVFKHIHKVITHNKEIEERIELLHTKMNELKKIFEEEELSKLKKLTFSFKTNKNKTE